jgi:hypothetical protein
MEAHDTQFYLDGCSTAIRFPESGTRAVGRSSLAYFPEMLKRKAGVDDWCENLTNGNLQIQNYSSKKAA